MNKRNLFLAGLLGIMLILSLVFSCSGDLGNADENSGYTPEPAVTVAETPALSDLASRNYAQSAEPANLSVSAVVSAGTLSYQWYSNTTLGTTGAAVIDGAIDDTYTPSTAQSGDTYYYVVVTNTDPTKTTTTAARTSNIARIRVTSGPIVPPTPAATINVNTNTRYQDIRGFGGMSNVWTSPSINVREIDLMFGQGPDSLGYNIYRICIYPYMDNLFNGLEEGPANDPTAHLNYYTMVRRAKRHGAIILASPWTPPAEMKSNDSRLTGYLKEESRAAYAQHIKDYIKRMADNGAAVDYVSLQNEPDIAVSYDGCEWSGEEMRDFVKEYGRFIAPADGPVGLMPGESYQFRDQFYNPIYNDAAAMDAVDVIGGHIYGGGLGRHAGAINAGKEVWMTEHLFNTSSNYNIDSQWQSVWTMIQEVHDCMVADFNAYIWWYSKRFYSLIGDGEYGTIDGRPLFRGYALSHYAKYATGKTRVAAPMTGGNNNVSVTAYESDNEITLVLFNKSPTVAIGQLNIAIPAAATGASMVITKGSSDTAVETRNERVMAPEIIVLNADGKTGTLDLPASCIISVRFSK
jgi:O-glycosyl hydrolase